MTKKLLSAIALILGIALGVQAATFAEEAHEPMPISEEAPDETVPIAEPDDSTLGAGSIGGGGNSADSDTTADQDDIEDTADSELDLGDWPLLLSIGAMVVAILAIIILNLRHRS